VDLHGIADIECGDILFQLFLFDFVDDVHVVLLGGKFVFGCVRAVGLRARGRIASESAGQLQPRK
jgi:hypothetical protein